MMSLNRHMSVQELVGLVKISDEWTNFKTVFRIFFNAIPQKFYVDS